MPKAYRFYRIGSKGNSWMWIVGGVGILGSTLAFVLSFIPPAQISTGGPVAWYSVLALGVIIMVAIPFIIYSFRKPGWRNPNTTFEPFHWEKVSKEQTKPTQHQ